MKETVTENGATVTYTDEPFTMPKRAELMTVKCVCGRPYHDDAFVRGRFGEVSYHTPAKVPIAFCSPACGMAWQAQQLQE